MIERRCPTCGATFTAARGVTYCSLTCEAAAYTVTVRTPTEPRRHLAHSAARGYDAAWRKLRLVVLDRDGWACRMPVNQAGRYDPDGDTMCGMFADTVDHVIEFVGLDDPLRLDPHNCRAACRPHNSAKAGINTTRKRRDAKQGMMSNEQ